LWEAENAYGKWFFAENSEFDVVFFEEDDFCSCLVRVACYCLFVWGVLGEVHLFECSLFEHFEGDFPAVDGLSGLEVLFELFCCVHFFLTLTTSPGSPVPSGTGWLRMTFSTTLFKSSLSPMRVAFMMCFMGVSKLARARTDSFSPVMPVLVTPLIIPVLVMTSASNMICLISMSRPWSLITLSDSLMMVWRAASMPKTSAISKRSLVMIFVLSISSMERLSARLDPAVWMV